ncbi:dienelactone hydrolase family protein [Balneola sp. MJW-20]|uniref:dienelactone hydrolase family protein n=1 Tax=Gracilimonas aurantiaca TaxID=3234185 RepID=UPI003464FCDA
MKYLVNMLLVAALFTACTGTENEMNGMADDGSSVMGEEISYTADTLTMNGYIAYDNSTSEKRPGILVVHEWWGHDEYARHRADMLAELGYVALAVDMYGNGKQAAHPEDAMAFSGNVMSNFENAKARFNAALETLKANPNVDTEKIGAIGYCFGGSVILSMANAGLDLDGVAAFHAGLQLPQMPAEGMTSRILILNGAEDQFVTDEQVENLTGALESINADYQYINYEGVMHSFTNPGADSLGAKFQLPLAYDAEADSLSWEEMKSFFDQTFADKSM